MIKNRTRSIIGVALLVAFIFSTVPALANNPDTNKPSPSSTKLSKKENPELVGKRDINNNQINFYSIEKEIAVGNQLAGEVERQLKFVEDPAIAEYINRVGQNIVLNSDAKVPFTIKVIDSDEVNAFALPGGFFFVNKGLIMAADNESELVGVMAHEIAHVAARHGTEQVSKGQLLNFGSIPLIFLGGPIGIAARSAAGFALPLTFLKFSRSAEQEADILGCQYAWASGYDPMGMVTMFEKLAAKEKTKVNKVFSDHPATGDRAKYVRELISKFPQKEEYVINTSDFNRLKAKLMAVSGSRRNVGSGDVDDRSGRPTLKRKRDDNDGSGNIDSTSPPPPPKERPTLKRRDGDPANNSNDDLDQPSSNQSDSPNRPKLKRADDDDKSDSDDD